MSLRVLLVEDEPSHRMALSHSIRAAEHRLEAVSDGSTALTALAGNVFDVAVCDVHVPRVDGISVMRTSRERFPSVDFLMMTSFAEVDEAVRVLRDGAIDYLRKPFKAADLLERLRQIEECRTARGALASTAGVLDEDVAWSGLIARSPEMKQVRRNAAKFAAAGAPVLISGESGTGKEIVARAIHIASPRASFPLVSVNCAAFPETLLEAELFGHEKGAFTGAQQRRDGRFKVADGGTLFLDEIAEMPLASQAKLLRVLQEGTFEPLGTNRSVHVDVRIISATNRDLRERTAAGQFREDLFYRLNVLPVHIPPVRERRSDILPLIAAFLRRHGRGKMPSLSTRAIAALTSADLPGNARELEHAIEYALALRGDGEIDLCHLPPGMVGRSPAPRLRATTFPTLGDALHEFEREHITHALSLSRGRRAEAASLLGISRKSLWQKMRSLGVRMDKDAEFL